MTRLRRLNRRIRGEPEITPGEIRLSDVATLLGVRDPVILEIGCNDGGETLRFLEAMPGARISCFEPDPRAQAAFRENVKNPRVELFEIAIGDVDGTIEFYPSGGTPPDPSREVRSGGWDLSGSIRKPRNHLKVHPWCTFEDAIQVPARKLDTWAREQRVKKIDFIWADVQGAEIDLVRGGRETLRNTRYLYTEYNNNEMYEGQVNLRTLLKELPDFEVVTAYRDDVLLRNRRFNS